MSFPAMMVSFSCEAMLERHSFFWLCSFLTFQLILLLNLTEKKLLDYGMLFEFKLCSNKDEYQDGLLSHKHI